MTELPAEGVFGALTGGVEIPPEVEVLNRGVAFNLPKSRIVEVRERSLEDLVMISSAKPAALEAPVEPTPLEDENLEILFLLLEEVVNSIMLNPCRLRTGRPIN